jgi:DNA repair exonuclease SbcCD ATPase subunit
MRAPSVHPPPHMTPRGMSAPPPPRMGAIESEEDFQARMLANYGDAPSRWFMAPLYAYRVWSRKQELARALAGRKEEADQARRAADDAMVALAERARPLAANNPQYTRALEELRNAEELLRSRDHVLAKEQDAHRERLESIDQRISKLEAEVSTIRYDERVVADELAAAEASLERATAKLKRAEIELRQAAAVQQQPAPPQQGTQIGMGPPMRNPGKP